jgi:hypothetical protein
MFSAELAAKGKPAVPGIENPGSMLPIVLTGSIIHMDAVNAALPKHGKSGNKKHFIPWQTFPIECNIHIFA